MDFGVVVDLKQTYLILELTKCEVHCESSSVCLRIIQYLAVSKQHFIVIKHFKHILLPSTFVSPVPLTNYRPGGTKSE